MGVKQAKKRIQTMKRMDTENKRRRQEMKLAEKYEQRGDEEKASKYFNKLEDLLSESEDEEAAVSSDDSNVGNGPLNGEIVDLANDNSSSNNNSITN